MKNSNQQHDFYSAIIDNSLPVPCDEIVMTTSDIEAPIEDVDTSDIYMYTCPIENYIVSMLHPVATFPMTGECHYSRDSIYKALAMMKEHCKCVYNQTSIDMEDIWKDPIEQTPESSKEYLVKIADMQYQISTWRQDYNIWACQIKDDSNVYKYKEIDNE